MGLDTSHLALGAINPSSLSSNNTRRNSFGVGHDCQHSKFSLLFTPYSFMESNLTFLTQKPSINLLDKLMEISGIIQL